jgi:SAM-dependent methyltransferase
MRSFRKRAFHAASRVFRAASRQFFSTLPSPTKPPDPELVERSRRRWRQSSPDNHLTWGKMLSGENFIKKVAAYGGFGPKKSVLELGPGYGRLLTACREQAVPFKDYLGLDVSATSVSHLTKAFPLPNIHFVVGNVETFSFDRSFDVFLSSLTLKHLFPTCEVALRNISNALNPRAKLFFDLIEGDWDRWEKDGTYIRCYTRREVHQLLGRARLRFTAFDTVEHDPQFIRLLVIAEKP